MIIFFSIAIGLALIAGAIAAIVRMISGHDALSLANGGLVFPVLITAALVYGVVTWTMEAHERSVGIIIISYMILLVIITPIPLLASHFTVKWLLRRPPPKTKNADTITATLQ